MARPLKPFFACIPLVLLLFAAPAWSVTVPPDSTSPPLDAIDCIFRSGSLDNVSDLTCPSTVCVQDCAASENQAKIGFAISNITVGRRFVETTVYTEFTVDPGTDGAGTELDGTILYDVEWLGGWYLAGVLTGLNDVRSNITLILWDQTDGKLVKQTEVHEMDVTAAGSLPEIPGEVGGGLDRGETTNSMTAKVIRGHTYRVGLKVRAEGQGALNASFNIDYISVDRGARWTDLRVSIAPDLEERLEKLEKRVEILEQQLRHHTHTYLTGRGEGHNNTIASTSEAIIVDNGPPSDDESNVLPPEPQDKKPMPAPTVLVTAAPNPFNPAATITYALPDRLPVTLRVYDARGRLVATLVDAEEEAGEHKVAFDATNLASGVYYYRVNAGPFTETRKITLLK